MADQKEKAEIEVVLSSGEVAGNTLRSLQTQANKLRKEIKGLVPGTQEFIDKSRDLKKVENEYSNISDQVKNVDEAQMSLNEAMAEYIPFAGQLQTFVKGYKNLSTATEKATFLTKVFGKTAATALAATGIGLLLVAFAALVNWVQKSQAAADFFGKSTAALGNVINVVTGRVVSFAKGMIALFSFDFDTAAEEMGKAFVGLGDDIAGAATAGWENAEALQAVTREEAKLELQKKKTRAEIEQYKKISEDTTKSLEEQTQAAQKAGDLEMQLAKDQEAVQSKRVKLLEERNAEAERTGMLNDEMINEAMEAEGRMAEFKEESTGKQTELQNKLNELKRNATEGEKAQMQEISDAEEEKRKERLEKEKEYSKMVLDAQKTLKDARIALMTDEQERQTEMALASYERDLLAFKGNQDQKDEYAILRAQQLDADLDAIEKENSKKAFEEKLKKLDEESQILEAKKNEEFYNGLITEEQRNQQLYELQVLAMQKRLAAMVANGSTETAEYAKLYTSLAQLHHDHEVEKTEKSKEEAKKREELALQGLAVAGSVFGGFAALLEQDEENRKKNLKTIKALKKAELLANLPLEISNIWSTSQAFGPILGPILAVAQSALAVVRTAKGLSEIDKIKYAKGGPVFGPSHAAGGIPFSVRGRGGYEMEGNEIIMTKGVYENPTLRAAASQLNVAGGGRSFAMGGPVNPLASTPVNPSSPGTVINNINNPAPPTDTAVAQEVRALRQDVAGWQRDFRVQLSLQQLDEANERMKAIELDTSI